MNLAFFDSKQGTTMRAVIKACASRRLDAHPRLLVSNHRTAEALKLAEAAGLVVRVCDEFARRGADARDEALLGLLLLHQIDVIVLGDYVETLDPQVVSHFWNRILNVHPRLLPEQGGTNYGLRFHQVLTALGETEVVAIILVSEERDLATALVYVEANDSPESLGARVQEKARDFLVTVLDDIRHQRIRLSPSEEDDVPDWDPGPVPDDPVPISRFRERSS